MKIAFANSSFFGGGISSYAYEFIDSYSKDNEIAVIIGDDSKHPINVKGVKVFRLEGNDTSLSNVKKIIDLINNIIKPDVLVCSNVAALSLAVPYLSNDIKIITISHNLKYWDCDVAVFNHKYVDAIVALSTHNKKYIQHRFGKKAEDKIHVVYNFVKENKNAHDILEKKIANRPVSIVYPGGAAFPKAPELVLKVLKSLLKTDLDFKFYWLGNTGMPLKGMTPIKNIKDTVKPDNRVIFTGYIPREEAEKIISNANIFFFPSRREGCPMTLLEAVSVGTIPIVSDCPHASTDLIIDGENGFIRNHNNPDGFVKLISDIIKTPDSYRDIYNNSYKIATTITSYSNWKNKMDSIIYDDSETKRYKRKAKFNVLTYNVDKIILKLIKIVDYLVPLFTERIPMVYSIHKQK